LFTIASFIKIFLSVSPLKHLPRPRQSPYKNFIIRVPFEATSLVQDSDSHSSLTGDTTIVSPLFSCLKINAKHISEESGKGKKKQMDLL